MHGTGCLGLVHWDDPEGGEGREEGGGFRMGRTSYFFFPLSGNSLFPTSLTGSLKEADPALPCHRPIT